MSYFNNKIIWITGASSGLGRSLTLALADQSVKLILSARNRKALEEVSVECMAKGMMEEHIKVLTLDLNDSFSLAQRGKEAMRLFGRVDILFNNGGISQRSHVIHTSLAVQREVMEVNYFGAISLSSLLLPSMIKRNSGHHVVISSGAAEISLPGRAAYAASKHAMKGFYESLQRELSPTNVKVTVVYPGYIKTNLSYNAKKGDGSLHGQEDPNQRKGLSPDFCAKKILAGVAKQQDTIFITGLKEKVGLWLQRFFPALLHHIVSDKTLDQLGSELN